MPNLTTRLSLPSPTYGEAPDGPAQLAAITAILDAAFLWSSGTYAARPAAPVAGHAYRQTDTGGGYPASTITVYNGSTWQVVTAAMVSVDSTTLVGTGATVQAMAEELDNAIVAAETATANHLADAVAAHAGSAISMSSATLVGTGTDVQAVAEELDNAIVAAETATANHLADASAAHAGSAISVNSATLVGVGTDVQAVLEELDNAIAVASGWSTLAVMTSYAVAGITAGTYLMGKGGALCDGSDTKLADMFDFDPADFAIAGRTLETRLVTRASTNATDPIDAGNPVQVSVYRITGSAGGANVVTDTAAITALAVSYSAAEITASLSGLRKTDSDVAGLTAGMHCIVVGINQITPANSVLRVMAMMQYRNV